MCADNDGLMDDAMLQLALMLGELASCVGVCFNYELLAGLLVLIHEILLHFKIKL